MSFLSSSLTRMLLAAWLAVGVLFVWTCGVPPVNRTQEARVLETAREMVGQPARDWLVPRLNGALRLRKPPLAYWMSAASMTVFGVNDRAGRLPATLLTWLSLAATFALARRWFGVRTAWLAAGALAGSWLFFRHGQLAETDAPAAALLTIGVWTIVRAADAVRRQMYGCHGLVRQAVSSSSPKTRPGVPDRGAHSADVNPNDAGVGDVLWLHAAAVCIAGVILSKGPSAAYLLLFWIGLCALRRDWRSLRRFVTRGGVVTMLVIAVPWFVYVGLTTTGEGQLAADLTNSVDGGDHHGPPWAYAPMLLRATMPWTAVWAAALVMSAIHLWPRLRAAFAVYRMANTTPADSLNGLTPARMAIGDLTARRTDQGLWELTAWGAAILVPLCVWGNKQAHYLLPLMPPTMILVGWALAGATRGWRRAKAAVIAGAITAALLAIVSPAVLVGARRLPGGVTGVDVAMAVVLSIGGVAILVLIRRARTTLAIATISTALAATVAVIDWLPARVGSVSENTSADLLAAFPDGRFVFRGTELPVMSWTLRRAIPLLDEPALAAASVDAKTVVLEQQQEIEAVPVPPAGYRIAREVRQAENILHVYVPQRQYE